MALDIGTKVENEGKNSQGRLSAVEFNQLIGVVKTLENNNVDGLVAKLTAINNKLKELENSGGSGGGASSEEIAELRRWCRYDVQRVYPEQHAFFGFCCPIR